MNRNDMLARIGSRHEIWDIIIIGGGATGTGAAVDAAARGYKTLLLEQGDFGQGTSSRSTKLVHGGVRYLQQGNVALVLEALKERGNLIRNAPHLVHHLPFIVPNYDWWEGPFYGIGLKLYDILAGREGLGKSRIISREETLRHIPTIESDGLDRGVIYYDGQFDDARLVINLVQTAFEQGATLINYMPVVKIIKKSDLVQGVIAHDLENGREYQLSARVVVNAAGVFCDALRQMDDPASPPLISPSQGIHIVLDKSFLPGDSAIMVPHTDDGRVLFAIPWHNRVIVGTTDTPLNHISVEPRPTAEEIEFLMTHAARYLSKDPQKEDILSIFAGIRPLVGSAESGNTAALSRDHHLSISRSGLVTITGGKWTTYRRMAEETIDLAVTVGQLEEKPHATASLQIHGYHLHAGEFGDLEAYGSDAPAIRDLIKQNQEYSEKIHPSSPVLVGEVVWAVTREMARTVNDFLSRRRRCLILDTRTSIEMAPKVATVMAKSLNKNKQWIKEQEKTFTTLAKGYLV